MTLKTSVDKFNHQRALESLADVPTDHVMTAFWQARYIAAENYMKQHNLIQEIAATKHSLEVLTNLNEQYRVAEVREDAAWRQYEVLRCVLIDRGVFDEHQVPVPKQGE
jgi:hypothetical protein